MDENPPMKWSKIYLLQFYIKCYLNKSLFSFSFQRKIVLVELRYKQLLINIQLECRHLTETLVQNKYCVQVLIMCKKVLHFYACNQMKGVWTVMKSCLIIGMLNYSR